MALTAFVGRVLFSAIFVISGLMKLSLYDAKSGGPVVQAMIPKLETFSQHFGGIPIPEVKYLLLIAIFLELVGGLLFIFGSSVGAYFLILFTIGVTPVMHNFWDFEKDTPEQQAEINNFMKNLALVGALLFFLGQASYKAAGKLDRLVRTVLWKIVLFPYWIIATPLGRAFFFLGLGLFMPNAITRSVFPGFNVQSAIAKFRAQLAQSEQEE
eukprot:jgi/Chlat1/8757/Chrsp9S08564